jgi:hypothetical protein
VITIILVLTHRLTNPREEGTMTLRFKVLGYTPHNPQTFEQDLEAWLRDHGTMSQAPDKGLTFSRVVHTAIPGSNVQKVLDAIIKKPGISKAKLGRRLVDLTQAQIETALRRLVRDKEVAAEPRILNRYKYFLYTATEKGIEQFKLRDEARENAKPAALLVWAGIKAAGYRRGEQIDTDLVQVELDGELEGAQFWAGLRVLQQAGKLDIAYNAGGAGHHEYYVH